MEEAPSDRCRYFEGLFSPYIEGELDPPERRALAEHLHECEECSTSFGARWRHAASRLVGSGSPRRRQRSSTGSAWLVVGACILGLVLLAAIGLLDASESRLPRPLGQERLARELAELVGVQTELLKAVAEPLRGATPPISHAARGVARDFFEALRRGAGTGAGTDAMLHPHFRFCDARPGGEDVTRAELVQRLAGIDPPAIELVDVVCALTEVTLCRVRWGERSALAWLLHQPQTRLVLVVLGE